jgi:hypothetical protein
MGEENIVTCESCGREIEYDPAGGEMAFDCDCGEAVVIDSGEDSETDLSPEDVAGKWFYEADNQRYGPVPLSRLRQLVAQGRLGPDNLLWRRGMEDWTPASEVELVRNALRTPEAAGYEEAPTQVYEIPEPGRRPERPAARAAKAEGSSDALVIALSGLCFLLGGAAVGGVPIVIYLGIRGHVTPLRTVVGTILLAFGAMLLLGTGQIIRYICRMGNRLRFIEGELLSRLPRRIP